MQNKKTIKLLTLVFTFLFLSFSAINIHAQQEVLNKAVQHFNNGDYKTALPLFKDLLVKNPEDALLNFYYGASRTESGFFSVKDYNHLLKAKDSNTPPKINYYLGIQSQAQNNWEDALKYYNKFRINASPEQQEDLSLTEKIQQCYNHENPYTSDKVSNPAIQEKKVLTVSDSLFQYHTTENKNTEVDSFNEQIIPTQSENQLKTITGKPIEFQVNYYITYLNSNQFKTDTGKNLYEKASSLKNELDFSLEQMEELREEYRSTSVMSEKNEIGKKIISFETETFQLKEKVTQLLLQARNAENEYWQEASPQEIEKFKSALMELSEHKTENPKENTEMEKSDSVLVIDSELLLGDSEVAQIVSEPEKKDELVYKIQIGAYRRGLPTYVDRLYKKLSLIRKIENYTDDKGVVVYTTGNLKNLDDAIKMQNQVRQEGVEDAFVVPYFNGKRITLEQAKKIEADL